MLGHRARANALAAGARVAAVGVDASGLALLADHAVVWLVRSDYATGTGLTVDGRYRVH